MKTHYIATARATERRSPPELKRPSTVSSALSALKSLGATIAKALGAPFRAAKREYAEYKLQSEQEAQARRSEAAYRAAFESSQDKRTSNDLTQEEYETTTYG